MIFDLGPFRLYRVPKNGTLDVSLICMENWACGWEYGWRDDARGLKEQPIVEFRIGKLMVLYLELNDNGCEVWFMGFWAFPTWKRGKRRSK